MIFQPSLGNDLKHFAETYQEEAKACGVRLGLGKKSA